MGVIQQVNQSLKKANIYPDIKVIDGNPSSNKILIEDKKRYLFCSYNYLGVANNKEIIDEIKNNLDNYGLSTGGTPLVSGTTNVHKKLETQINQWLKTESSMLFSSGAAANISIIPAMANAPIFLNDFSVLKYFKKNVECYIFSDELNHATIIDGCRLSKATKVIFRHKDLSDLEDKLSHVKNVWKIIITDGIFSMDGDIAPLPGIIDLAKKYNALTIIDDAHATGVLGRRGGGTPDHYSVQNLVDIQTSALGKAVGVIGGFVTSTREIIDYLRVGSRSYIFSASIPSAFAAGTIKAVEIIADCYGLRKKLWFNSDYLRNSLKEKGFNTHLSESPSPIIPVIIGDEKKAINISDDLFKRNIFVPAIRFPAVAKEFARIRLTVMATHDKNDLDYLIKNLFEVGKFYKIIH